MTELKASKLWIEYVEIDIELLRMKTDEPPNIARAVEKNLELLEKGIELTMAIEAQEKELSVLKRQVEEFKPAFILQQVRAGNFNHDIIF